MTAQAAQVTAVGDTDARPAEDAAWVTIETRLDEAELRAFICDVERMWRINPLLDRINVTRDAGGRGRLEARNLANGRDVNVGFLIREVPGGIDVDYADGLKTRTSFRIEPDATGARLTVRDEYAGAVSEKERQARLGEVDTSLNAWGRALSDFLRHWRRWSWLPPWRWYISRAWLPMSPSGRRIVFLIWVISVVEVISVAALALILAAAHRT